jgi:predicted nucleic acid-binding protein
LAHDVALAVVDASVALKWFVSAGEEGVDDGAQLLDDHAEGVVRLVAPALLVHEVLNALRRRSGDKAPDLSDAMDALFDTGVLLVPPDRELMLLAARLVAERCLSTYDAAYAALARTLDCELVTADRRLANALGDGFRVRVV